MSNTFKLLVGYKFENNYLRNVSLLPSNGVAEKVFTAKIPDRPFTWMGYVISIAVKDIDGVPVGAKCREEYVKTKGLTIPQVILQMPFADMNTATLEIHRLVWENLLKEQDNMCKFCAKPMKMDIDLNCIKVEPEDEDKIDTEYSEITVDLPEGLIYTPLGAGDKKILPEFEGMNFNRLVFRIPTLADAIRNEKSADDTILFWRKIAYDCLIRIESVDSGTVTAEIPPEKKFAFGPKLMDEMLGRKDLQAIRDGIREALPTLPFSYETECPCPQKRVIPVAMSANSFFSE